MGGNAFQLSVEKRSNVDFAFENIHENEILGVPVVAQCLANPTRNHEVAGSIPGLAQWIK